MIDRLTSSVWTFVLVTATCFSVGALSTKALLDDGVDPIAFTALTFATAAGVAVVVAWRRGELMREAVAAGVVLGLTNTMAPALLFNLGFERLPAGVVTLLISFGPVVTAVAAHRVFPDERFGSHKLIGLVLAVAGVAVLALGPGSPAGSASYGGVALVLVGTLFAGVSAVLARRLAVSFGAAPLVAPSLASAAIAAGVIGWALGRDMTPNGGPGQWLALVAVGLGANYVGFRSMIQANQIGTTGQVSVIGYLLPVAGVIGGWLVFGDALTVAVVGGGLLILVAVAFIGRGSTPQVIDPTPDLYAQR